MNIQSPKSSTIIKMLDNENKEHTFYNLNDYYTAYATDPAFSPINVSQEIEAISTQFNKTYSDNNNTIEVYNNQMEEFAKAVNSSLKNLQNLFNNISNKINKSMSSKYSKLQKSINDVSKLNSLVISDYQSLKTKVVLDVGLVNTIESNKQIIESKISELKKFEFKEDFLKMNPTQFLMANIKTLVDYMFESLDKLNLGIDYKELVTYIAEVKKVSLGFKSNSDIDKSKSDTKKKMKEEQKLDKKYANDNNHSNQTYDGNMTNNMSNLRMNTSEQRSRILSLNNTQRNINTLLITSINKINAPDFAKQESKFTPKYDKPRYYANDKCASNSWQFSLRGDQNPSNLSKNDSKKNVKQKTLKIDNINVKEITDNGHMMNKSDSNFRVGGFGDIGNSLQNRINYFEGMKPQEQINNTNNKKMNLINIGSNYDTPDWANSMKK